jgi:hypothetical protein
MGGPKLPGVSNFHLPWLRRQMNKKAVLYLCRRRLLEGVEGVLQLAPNRLKSNHQRHPNHSGN